jgi:hypothetical protein
MYKTGRRWISDHRLFNIKSQIILPVHFISNNYTSEMIIQPGIHCAARRKKTSAVLPMLYKKRHYKVSHVRVYLHNKTIPLESSLRLYPGTNIRMVRKIKKTWASFHIWQLLLYILVRFYTLHTDFQVSCVYWQMAHFCICSLLEGSKYLW